MKYKFLFGGVLLVVFSLLLYFSVPMFTQLSYDIDDLSAIGLSQNESLEETVEEKQEDIFVVTHISTPIPVRAIYMTQCVAGTPSFREKLVKLADETEVNSIIIDIKDYTGGIGFIPYYDKSLEDKLSSRCYAADMRSFIGYLHKKGIYVIGRITVFQDPLFANAHPNLAVQKESDRSIWSDYKGIQFVDVGAQEMWDYIITLSKESYAIGFDELNFDYIRFPSDGNMRDIYYPISEERILADPDLGKAEILREFFTYLHDGLKNTGVVLSADLFGMTTTNSDDLNIGQILEYAEPYFDYLAPMVYPSHYPKWFNGYEFPAQRPYDVVKFSMDQGVKKLLAASSTPSKLRPWLQDFDLGAVYDADMVRAQMQAVYDAGLDSWMLWDPTNIYTRAALLDDKKIDNN